MNVIIVGAGEVGRHAAAVLSAEGHNIVLLDRNPAVFKEVAEQLDIHTMVSSATDAERLTEAGVADCDLFFAATDNDETNLLSAAIANGLGADYIVARVHHSGYYQGRGLDYARHLGIDTLICPEHLTSHKMATKLRNPGALAVEDFARGQIQMQQLAVDNEGLATRLPLEKLAVGRGVRLVTVQRGGDVFLPTRDTVLRLGDKVVIVGEPKPIEKAISLIQKEKASRFHVAIMGASAVGVWLSRALRGSQFSVRLFELDRARAEEVSVKLPHVTVVQADPTDRAVFNEESIAEADAFVAVSNDDEHNILATMQAKALGVKLTMAVIQQSKYLHLLERVGVDCAFSPRMVAGGELLKIVHAGPMQLIASVSEGAADVYEIRVPRHSPVCSRPLKDIPFPLGCIMAAIQRDSKVWVPGGQDTIEPGDSLLAVLHHGQEKTVRRLFFGS